MGRGKSSKAKKASAPEVATAAGGDDEPQRPPSPERPVPVDLLVAQRQAKQARRKAAQQREANRVAESQKRKPRCLSSSNIVIECIISAVWATRGEGQSPSRLW